MRKVPTAVRRAAVFVDHWQWLVLLLAAPLLMFPTPARSPILLVVPGLWIIAGLAGKGCLPRTPLNGSLLVLAVMVLISLYATYDVEVSLPKIAGLVFGFGVYFAVVRLGRERATGWKVYAAFLVIGVTVAGVGLLGTQWLNKIAFLSPILNRLAGAARMAGAEEVSTQSWLVCWVLPALLDGCCRASVAGQPPLGARTQPGYDRWQCRSGSACLGSVWADAIAQRVHWVGGRTGSDGDRLDTGPVARLGDRWTDSSAGRGGRVCLAAQHVRRNGTG
jgi:hypothetical protein